MKEKENKTERFLVEFHALCEKYNLTVDRYPSYDHDENPIGETQYLHVDSGGDVWELADLMPEDRVNG